MDHDSQCESELTSHGYTPCMCHERAGICYCRKNPCVCIPDSEPVIPTLDEERNRRIVAEENLRMMTENAKSLKVGVRVLGDQVREDGVTILKLREALKCGASGHALHYCANCGNHVGDDVVGVSDGER